MPASFPLSAFKAYDIRGTVPDPLDERFAHSLGLALAQQALALGLGRIAVGYDGRASGPTLEQALVEGLSEGGLDCLRLGMVPTPVVYYAAHEHSQGSGVAITGSHNPPEYNGFKLMLGGTTLHGDAIRALHGLMTGAPAPAARQAGALQSLPVLDAYLARITGDVHLARPMRVAIDCGNGVGGVIAERLFSTLGCTVDALYCAVDAGFPNHHPDPADPANLQDLIRHVRNSDCELGLAFDGDADRLGVVTRSGQIIWPDRQLILFARDVLARNAGAPILFDVKCSRHVAAAITEAGGQARMSRTGHSLIKAAMAECDAPLAGEMSGHIFFGERWFGFDDGLYAGARLLEILSRHANPSTVLEALPQDISTPEIKLALREGEPHALIERLQAQGEFPTSHTRITMDGVRAEYADGFGLARASNTTPVVVLRFEGETPEAIARIQEEFRRALLALEPALTLPF
ncbi:MAG: phosphomannomutase/phosphoglucomutase [Castellaniella sp.]